METRTNNMLLTTLAICLVIGLTGFWLRDDGRIGSGETGLELGVPVEHRLQRGFEVTPLPVVLRLVNRSDKIVDLTADGPCKVFRYVVTTSDGGFIQAVRRPESAKKPRPAAPWPKTTRWRKSGRCRWPPTATAPAIMCCASNSGIMKAKPASRWSTERRYSRFGKAGPISPSTGNPFGRMRPACARSPFHSARSSNTRSRPALSEIFSPSASA